MKEGYTEVRPDPCFRLAFFDKTLFSLQIGLIFHISHFPDPHLPEWSLIGFWISSKLSKKVVISLDFSLEIRIWDLLLKISKEGKPLE